MVFFLVIVAVLVLRSNATFEAFGLADAEMLISGCLYINIIAWRKTNIREVLKDVSQ